MRRLTGRPAAVAAALIAAGVAAGCAQPSAPPGGPPDPLPPVVVSVSPDSGATGARPEEVVFRFDEVVSERPASVTSLEQLVLISPREGAPRVRWRRDAISVRPGGGFRDSTVYVVQLLPGIADLRGNVRDSIAVTVFSTGGPIPGTQLTGVVFDWVAQRAVPGALVQAITRPDSVVYVTRSDSSGRFVLPFVPPGAITVVGALDENRNFAIDEREAWDSTAVTLGDSARVELYAFVHDTVGPAVRDVTVSDSVTLRLTLDRPLATDQPVSAELVALYTADSVAVPLASVSAVATRDTARARPAADSAVADSAAVADTAAAARPAPRPAVPPARADSAADTTRRLPPPVPSRPPPTTQLDVRATQPLAAGARYVIELREARNLLGFPRTSQRSFEVPAPDTTTRDTTARDTTARDTTARDTTARDSIGATPPRTTPPPATPPPASSNGVRPAAAIGEPPRPPRSPR